MRTILIDGRVLGAGKICRIVEMSNEYHNPTLQFWGAVILEKRLHVIYRWAYSLPLSAKSPVVAI